MFSATFRKPVEKLAREILEEPVRVLVGVAGEANQDVTQTVTVIHAGQSKWTWLTERMNGFTDAGSLLIFVTKKANCQMLAENLQKNGYPGSLVLHGDMDQNSRTRVISDFKKARSNIMVATDIAARGLDIPLVKVRLPPSRVWCVGRGFVCNRMGAALTLSALRYRRLSTLM